MDAERPTSCGDDLPLVGRWSKLEIQGLNNHEAHEKVGDVESLQVSLRSRSMCGPVTCEGFKPLDVS
jgi:hypothetical protein